MLPNVSHLFFIADEFGCSCPVSLPWILKQQKNRPCISFLTPWLKTSVQVLECKHASLKKKQSNKHLSFILYQGSYLCKMHFEMESDVRHLFKHTFKRFPRKKNNDELSIIKWHVIFVLNWGTMTSLKLHLVTCSFYLTCTLTIWLL